MLKPSHPLLRAGLVVIALAGAAACASGGNGDAKKRVDIDLVELTGPQNVQLQGAFDVQYGVSVRNLSTQPVTIRRVQVTQVGSGPYVVERTQANTNFNFSQLVAPGAEGDVSFWMHAYQRVMPGDLNASEPLNMRVVVFFDSPTGHFQEITHKIIPQGGPQ